jgi:ketosteroid isomerase-like protein
MASANVEIVRSLYADWERGDFSESDWAHPEVEFVFADGPEGGSWTGVAGMARGAREGLRAWEGYRVQADEYRELDAERVLVFVHRRGRGRTSGIDIAQVGAEGAHIFHLRDGKVMRLIAYVDRARALADLGLSE